MADIADLAKSLLEDAEYVDKLSDEEVTKLRQMVNPYAVTVEDTNKSFINISIINWHEQYMTKLITTSLIGYLQRISTEWDPREDMVNGDKLMSEAEVEAQRKVIAAFLNRHFKFNVDHHVRAAQSENKADPSRKPLAELMAEAKSKLGPVAVDPQYLADEAAGIATLGADICTDVQKYRKLIGAVTAGIPEFADFDTLIAKRAESLRTKCETLGSKTAGLKAVQTLNMLKMDPPVDVFYHLRRYTQNHYESIREVVEAAYNEKPDLEFAAIYYSHHATAEEAKQYRVKNESDFKCELFTLTPGVSVLGPFKENRDRVDFYNKNTEVVKRLLEQLEADHKLGKDLMEKKIKTKKAKSVAEVGRDAPGLAAYSKAIGTVESLGTKKMLTAEEAEELAKAKLTKEMAEVPEDAIKCDVFYADGKGGLKKTHFYTQAEAPKHMEQNSEFVGKYQPPKN